MIIHGLMRDMWGVFKSCGETTYKSGGMTRVLGLDLDGLDLLILHMLWTEAELLMQERLLDIREWLIIIDMILCDIFVVVIIVDILNWTGSLVNNLYIYHRWVLNWATVKLSVMMELLTDLNTSVGIMLKWLMNASLSSSIVLFIFHELRCILTLEVLTDCLSWNLRRLLNLIWILTLFVYFWTRSTSTPATIWTFPG